MIFQILPLSSYTGTTPNHTQDHFIQQNKTKQNKTKQTFTNIYSQTFTSHTTQNQKHSLPLSPSQLTITTLLTITITTLLTIIKGTRKRNIFLCSKVPGNTAGGKHVGELLLLFVVLNFLKFLKFLKFFIPFFRTKVGVSIFPHCFFFRFLVSRFSIFSVRVVFSRKKHFF